MNRPVGTPTSTLSPDERRRLLARMLQEKASRPAERPLSLGQERIRLMARLDPDSPLYNIAVAYRLHGPLDLAALERGRPAHRGTPRDAAGHVPRRGRTARSSSSAPTSRPRSRSRTIGTSPRPSARPGSGRAGDGGGAAPVRPGAGPAVARQGHPMVGRRTRSRRGHAPHRLGRLVVLRLLPRAGRVLRRSPIGPDAPPARAAHPVSPSSASGSGSGSRAGSTRSNWPTGARTWEAKSPGSGCPPIARARPR